MVANLDVTPGAGSDPTGDPTTKKRPRSALGSRLILSLMALALFISTNGAGCSIRKVAYGWVTRLAVNRISEIWDLDAAQKRDLQPRISAIHDWHRKNELPRYVQLLDGVMAKVQDGLDQKEVEWMLSESTAAVERLSARFSPEAGQFLTTLRDEQIAHAGPELKKSERERFEKLEMSEQEYIQFRLKQARKNMKTWLGSYSDAQLAEFEKFVRKNRLEEQRRRKKMQENQEQLLRTLRAHPGPKVLETMVHRWLTRQTFDESPEYQRAEEQNRADFVDLVVAVDRLMTSEQRAHLLNELKGWRSDFYELANGI